MERLTEYESIAGHVHAIPIVSDMDAIMMRLAAYEDAGLTPGEVRCLWGEWRAMMRVLNSIGSYVTDSGFGNYCRPILCCYARASVLEDE